MTPDNSIHDTQSQDTWYCWVMHMLHMGKSHCQVKFLSKLMGSSCSFASERRPIDMSKPHLFHLDNLRPQYCKRCKCLISEFGRFQHVQKCASELDSITPWSLTVGFIPFQSYTHQLKLPSHDLDVCQFKDWFETSSKLVCRISSQ